MKRIASLLLTAAGLLLIVSCQRTGSTTKSGKMASAAIQQDTARTVAVAEPAPPATPVAEPEIAKPTVAGTARSAAPAPTTPDKPESGMAALERAAKAGKYLMLFCYKDDDDSTREMRGIFDAAARKSAGRAISAVVKVTDDLQKDVVAKFQLERAPMPLALVIAANGAVTGGFPSKVTKEQLTDAFVSPGLANCLKAMQEGKLVLLCAQNGKTKSNDAAMRGVNDFKADDRFAKFTEVVKIDPTDAGEQKFLTQLKIDPKTNEAITFFLAPPGAVIAKYNGATDKDTMIAALTAATSGGCGSGGCAPSGCGPTK